MANLTDVVNLVDTAKLYLINLLKEVLKQMESGCEPSFKTVTQIRRLIRGLTFQINAQVMDDTTLSLYKCLIKIIGMYGGNYVIDPSVQVPGQTIVINVDNIINSGKLVFSGTEIEFDNYQSLYVQLYGDNPDLAIYNYIRDPDTNEIIGAIEDTGTVPSVNYVPNSSPKQVESITFGYAIPTDGFLQISGFVPNIAPGGDYNNETPVKSGTYTATGDGELLVITIPHGFSGISSASKVFITQRGPDAEDWTGADCDATNVYIYYDVAPPAPSVPDVPNLTYNITFN